MSNFGRKVALAAVAFATVGSTAFGGVALASGDQDLQDAVAGPGGRNGDCISLIGGNQILGGVGILGVGKSGDATQCVQSANGGNATNTIGG